MRRNINKKLAQLFIFVVMISIISVAFSVAIFADSDGIDLKSAGYYIQFSQTHYSYTGNEVIPSFTVTNGTDVLVKGHDYSVGYGMNVEPGIALLVVNGRGRFSGSLLANYYIDEGSSSPTAHKVIIDQVINGTVSVSKTSAYSGEKITLTLYPNAGYVLEYIYVNNNIIHDTSFTMGNSDVKVSVVFKKDTTQYSITLKDPTNGTATLSKNKACYGEEITITANPDVGYELDTISVNGKKIDGTKFTMGSSNTTVIVTFKNIVEYSIKINETENGRVTASKSKAFSGELITLNFYPDEGYLINSITINGKKMYGSTFTMPSESVTIAVTFKQSVKSGTLGEDLTWAWDGQDCLTIEGTGNIPDYRFSTQTPWYTFSGKIKTIYIFGNVSKIGNNTFSDFSELVSVVIPASVTSIGERAFYKCRHLTELALPKNVKTIDTYAFFKCTALKSISIPASVTSIGEYAFDGCDSIDDIYYGGNKNAWLKISIDSNNNPLTANRFHFSDSSVVRFGTSGTGITWILDDEGKLTISGSGSFSGKISKYNADILTVVFEGNINQIDNSAFSDCINLSNITIPNSVKKIGYSAFSGCKKLKSISIPYGVTEIGESAFSGCKALKNIAIPNSVTSIGKYAFSNSGISEIVIPDSLTSIGVEVFRGCSSLKDVTLPETLKSIGQLAFSGCSNLRKIYIPVSVTAFGENTFYLSSKLTDIYYGGSESQWNKIKIEDHNLVNSYISMSSAQGRTYFAVVDNANKHFTHKISFNGLENGTASLSKTKAFDGDEIIVSAKPANGYELDIIKVNNVSIEGSSFTMPDEDVTVDVLFKKKDYSIIVADTSGGKVEVDKAKAKLGETITVSFTSDTCYELDNIKINGKEITGYTFEMPAANVIVSVSFKSKPHELSLIVEKPASCTVEGHEAYYECNKCHKKFSDSEGTKEISKPNAIAALDHNWDEGEVTKEPACEETGVKTFHCTRSGCTETKTESIKALGHKIVEVAEKAPTKTEPGNIKHYKCERCGKLFSDANGKTEITKAQTVIPAMGHDLTAVKAQAATCTEPGNTAYYICKDDDCKCGKVYSDPYGQHEINIEDTVILALGHNPKEVAGKDPTCAEDGYEKYYKCSRCNKLFSDADGKNEIEKPVVIPKLGHDMKHIDAKKPTHEDDGHKEYYHCNRCGKNFADEDGKTALTDAEIVVPHIGAAVLGEEITDGDFKYKVTNPRTDGTGTVTLIGVENETEAVVIPATVELKLDTYKVNRIGPKAFYNNKTIKSLYIGANVVIIDSSAFYGCSYLVKVSGGKALQTINASAFAYCSRLKSFSIASPVLKKIGPNTFYKDKKLKTIYIQKTTRLTKAGVKKSLKGSSVKTVKVKKSKVKKYKKYFKKKNSGRKVKVKK